MDLKDVDPFNVIDFSEWQQIVDILARMAGVVSAAITRIELPYIEAFKVSQSDSSPFYEGMRVEVSNHYCEEIFSLKEKVIIENALKDEKWMNAPEIAHGLISYMGYPLLMPNGEIFGTICVHDNKENSYSTEIDTLMHHFKKVVESHFVLADQTKRLKESEARYKSLVENAADAIFLLDSSGRIDDVNSEACRRYGYPYDQLTQMHIQDLGFASKSSGRAWWIQECLDNGQVVFEASHRSRDGADIPVEINARKTDHPKRPAILAMARDISTRKQMEQLKEDIERITRHDLKTPLSGIINLPEMLLNHDNLRENQRELLQMIRSAGYRMLDMINSSLSLYQMEQGQYPFSPSRIDLVPIVRDVQNDVLDSLHRDEVHLCIRANGKDCSDKDAFFIYGESWLCYSMIGNLLKNAVEASPADANVFVDLDLDATGLARITITSDSLIPEAIRNRFGQKYVTSNKRYGTGLGVYSARLIAETMNGTFTWTSSEKAGTAVSVFLPRGRAAGREIES